MTRAMAFKPTIMTALRAAGYVLCCLVIGSLAGRIVKYFGGPMELRVLASTVVVAIGLAFVWYDRKFEAKPVPERIEAPADGPK